MSELSNCDGNTSATRDVSRIPQTSCMGSPWHYNKRSDNLDAAFFHHIFPTNFLCANQQAGGVKDQPLIPHVPRLLEHLIGTLDMEQ